MSVSNFLLDLTIKKESGNGNGLGTGKGKWNWQNKEAMILVKQEMIFVYINVFGYLLN